MKYNFDQVIDRSGTLSYKWDARELNFPKNPQALPFWIADMDFPCPEPIVRAVQKRAAHPIYGYSMVSDRAREGIAAWEKKRNGWDVDPEWVEFSNGVVPALSAMVAAFTDVGEGVIIQPPVYYPFRETVENNGRKVVNNCLLFDGQRWNINFDELEQLAAEPENKLLLLCHPLNPVSRVLDVEELKRVADICLRHHVILAVDEIHSDLIYRHCRFHSMAALSKEIEQICVVATAPSKTFNVAGLQMSAIIIANEELRHKFQKETDKRVMYIANLFGATAFEAAYSDPECEEYLEQLIDYLWENYQFLDQYLRENMPKIKCQKPDATYLLWLDCRELGLNSEELQKFCLEEAGVAFDVGEWFGGDGDGFMRINIGCPRSLLKEGLDRMKAAYDRRNFLRQERRLKMGKYKAGDFFPNLLVKTAFAPDRKVRDVLRGKTVFWVLRYIGCPVCRLDVALIAKRYQEFEKLGAQVFVVMQSDCEHVREALKEEKLPFSIICDSDMQFYHTLMIEPAASMEALAGKRLDALQEKGRQASAYGFVHGDYEGDEQQLPALFIVDETGVITYAHYAQELIDMPDIDTVLGLLKDPE